MKLQIFSQWQGGIYIPSRVRQFTKAARLCGRNNFREYSGIISASSERAAIGEWIDSKTPLKRADSVA